MNIQFTAPVWLWHAEKASWWFVTLPPEATDQVRFAMRGRPRKGFGSVKVKVKLGDSEWRTSLFPDKARDSYLLPIKASVRKAEGLLQGGDVAVALTLVDI